MTGSQGTKAQKGLRPAQGIVHASGDRVWGSSLLSSFSPITKLSSGTQLLLLIATYWDLLRPHEEGTIMSP